MPNRNPSITINGQRYEAQSNSIAGQPARSIDGLVRGRLVVQPSQLITPEPVIKKTLPQITRQAASAARVHKAEASATLMRRAVTKPDSVSLKRHTKVQSSTLSLASQPALIKPKTSLGQLNHGRLSRADQVITSARISRFSAPAKSPLIAPSVVVAASFRPDIAHTSKPAQSNDIFEAALARATSHEQAAPEVASLTKKRSKGRRVAAYASGAVAVIAIASLLSVQLVGGLRFKLATSKAGFAATMPAYKPAGYSLAKLSSSSGFLGIKFSGPNSSFALTEKPSNWNSQTLLSNIVGDNQSFNTINSAGRTLYLYGKDEAAWVNNGILYKVADYSSLSSQQLANLAASM